MDGSLQDFLFFHVLFRFKEDFDNAAGPSCFVLELPTHVLGQVMIHEFTEDAVHRSGGDTDNVCQLGGGKPLASGIPAGLIQIGNNAHAYF